uniref:MAK10-like protein n=1 Tax=Tanacetum cinerariifolium TaxID=118510 RepID=A0A699HWW0_TANCI|nr:MAK10-like protein [Tanacetum cinerariifolium]
MEERTSRWVDKRIKKFNVYERYSVGHWKNMWEKQDHIRRKKQLKNNPHEVYSESEIVKIIRTTYEWGHEHKFITEIIVRRASGKTDSITKPDYKYLNKNDIKYMYLLCINDKFGMRSYQQKVNLTAITITLSGIEKYKLFTIVSKPICGMIYESKKKEKRVMTHKEMHKFPDVSLERVLEGLEKYNKDVKCGYANPSHNKDHVELLRFYKENIRECLKHQDQMRHNEIMEDENPFRTLGDYFGPSHEGYQNPIELLDGNNVVPLRSDTIRLVQNGCSFHRLRFEDPVQHIKDILKLMDSLDLDVTNRERTLLHLFQFSLHDQASNWLEHLPAGSISTWEDLTTRFLA